MSSSKTTAFAKRARALLAVASGLVPAAAVGADGTDGAKPGCMISHTVTQNAVVDGEIYRLNSETDYRAVYRIQLIPKAAAGGQDASKATLAIWYHWTPGATRQYQMALRNPFYKEGESIAPGREIFFDIGGAKHIAVYPSPNVEWLTVSGWEGGNGLPSAEADPTVMFRNTTVDTPNITFTYPIADAKQAFGVAPQVFNALVDYANKGECTVNHQFGGDPYGSYDDLDWDCFLTTATCEVVGLEDDCWELTTLRRFRDGWLAWQEGGVEDIARYYRDAPAIARALGSDRQAALRLYWTRIVPSALAAQLGANKLARRIYTRMMGELGVA